LEAEENLGGEKIVEDLSIQGFFVTSKQCPRSIRFFTDPGPVLRILILM
jgi:hypothetical protein